MNLPRRISTPFSYIAPFARVLRMFFVLSLVPLLFAACIAAPVPAETTSSETPNTETITETATISSTDASTESVDAESAGKESTNEETAETRLFTHAMGETAIPVSPQRVVVLDAVDNAIALGIQPVGAAQWMGTQTGMDAAWPSYNDPADYEGIVFLGSNQQPNLELLVGLNPDLIIGRKRFHEEIYSQLSEIAPTVLDGIEGGSGKWREEFFFHADALGKIAEAEQLMAEYEARAAGIAEKLQQLEVNPSVAIVRFDPAQISLYQERGHFAGEVLFDAGVVRPENQRGEGQVKLSLEEITEIDADVLFPMISNPEDSMYDDAAANPIWQQLRSVQNGQVYEVPFDLWVGGWTIIGAHHILDQLELYLLGEE